MPGSPSNVATPAPAASVVLLRDTDAGPEILYLRRNPDLRFMGGYWVFPGGRVDPGDHLPGGDADEKDAARRAAAREAHEEAGVRVDPADLHLSLSVDDPDVQPDPLRDLVLRSGVEPGDGPRRRGRDP